MSFLMARRGRSRLLRRLLVAAALGAAVAPTLPLLWAAVGQQAARPVWTKAFADSVGSGLLVGAGVSLLSLVLGLPLGLLAVLYRFPGRAPLALFQALPLLLPSFLLCIGWSNLAAAQWLAWPWPPSGVVGCMFVLGVQAASLPFFAVWAACHQLTASQIDAARLQGGERAVLQLSARACAPVALLAALLGGVLSLSDPGAPLILGCRSVAVEIRTSFSALLDYDLAGRQCLLLAALVLLLIGPLLALGMPALASAVLARQIRPAAAYAHPVLRWIAAGGLVALLTVGVVLPTLGLCAAALENPMFEHALGKLHDTAATTLIVAGGAGVVAVLWAAAVALAAANDRPARVTVLAVLLALLAMPPALAAIGVSGLATHSPPQLDWLTRSRLTVALVLGVRFLPVATVAMLRAVGSLSPSWADAARLHGVAPARLLGRVLLPILTPAIVVSLVLVMVLSAADITTTHLLQPPGTQSLPVAIFTIMANSPEGLVASLCLLYLLCVVALLALAAQLPRWWPRSAV